VHVHASADVLRKRLRARQRESGAEVEARLLRALAFDPPADAFCLSNDLDLDSAGQRLKDHLFSPGAPVQALRVASTWAAPPPR
jgi:ribose 1,5-bisphosphokinase